MYRYDKSKILSNNRVRFQLQMCIHVLAYYENGCTETGACTADSKGPSGKDGLLLSSVANLTVTATSQILATRASSNFSHLMLYYQLISFLHVITIPKGIT